MNTPLISIIVPVYNSSPFLNRCLDSILSQTFTKFEVILVNDGSTDNSGNICDEYATKDKRFYVFHKQNQGSSIARKFGVKQSKCKLVTFIDSDDDIHPNYIKTLFECISNYNSDIAMCDFQRVEINSSPKPCTFEPPKVLNQEELFNMFFKYYFWGFPGKIYNKSLFNHIYFPTYNINEDYVVMAQLFIQQHKVVYIPSPLYHYRSNPTSQSNIRLSPTILDEYHNKKWVFDYYQTECPKYATKAKEHLIETCIKLLGIIQKNDTHNKYSTERHILKKNLIDNLGFILFKSKLLPGIKAITLKRIIS